MAESKSTIPFDLDNRQARRAANRTRAEALQATRKERRAAKRANPSALRKWMRWALRQVGAAGKAVAHELIDDAIDLLADKAAGALDLGDTPFAEDAEALLIETVVTEGRQGLHKVARALLQEDETPSRL